MPSVKIEMTITEARQFSKELRAASFGCELVCKISDMIDAQLTRYDAERKAKPPLRKIVERISADSFTTHRRVNLECGHSFSFKWTNTNADRYSIGRRVSCGKCSEISGSANV